ncbi:MAG: hypothetical protein UR69_C0003G0087 [Candidatus Moranbacteria bacterium GW2011_GWE2_35_2-]|nr:MAG: hypothetical protein UR69_C0003G0087 [Candidatus Moranbacteria bacterium GW2011_GWE2_35_2-]KKQ22106.1 MAG: hypothetical protein US37_C0004G0065 [Candidatus Moranbacteria bacterium GW2011_GWF2_37_11]KKQ29142.1 MAG: hypothetical protein US44_C0003G0054 [Candidatus Moranbacteria bacterium GW2011_GWD1_37_17]KKQ31127.1 MAG: hypothetical protein US47_C0001G0360 [Candidatus Moranbacteria bacterium GW2011_GWE1_37_24]KKQ47073.1 MAG: hypothetical protein US66_C0020G0011 [Candidatus Moranbacteria 
MLEKHRVHLMASLGLWRGAKVRDEPNKKEVCYVEKQEAG